MRITQQVIILSAELTNQSYAVNRERTKELQDNLITFNFTHNIGQGNYKGSKETSFIVIVRDDTDRALLKYFAFEMYNQESILYQDANGMSYLEYQNGTSEKIGRLKEYDIDKASEFEAYTIVNKTLWAV